MQPVQQFGAVVAAQYERILPVAGKAADLVEAHFELGHPHPQSGLLHLGQQARRQARIVAQMMQGDMQALARQRVPGQTMFLAQPLGQLGNPRGRGRVRQHREEQALGGNVAAKTQRQLGLGRRKILRHDLA